MWKYWIVCVVFGLSLGMASLSQAKLWNQVVAEFQDRVVTYWELEREFQVSQMMLGQKTTTPSKEALKTYLKKKIIEELILIEAESFDLNTVSQVEAGALLQNFKAKFKSEAEYHQFLDEFHWREEELKKILVRPLLVEKFIKKKIDAAFVHVSREEVSTAQKAYRGISSIEILKNLKREKIKKNLNDWILAMKRQGHIQILLE
ncbi:MAG: SurA N-terminal domain-containing protein [Deltaproteobacteria bacterium]|nr:SurA N-terminal domain-containing protein [Deltaproteobacteria bacterium]